MPTSAQDRLGQLLANQPHPTKPATERSVPPAGGLQQSQLDHSSATKHTDECSASPTACQAMVTAGDKNTVSSEDDEYSALFEKKPEMKFKVPRKQPDSALGVPECLEDNRKKSIKSIESVAEVEASSRASRPSNERDVVDNEDAETYTGNEHPLIGTFCPFHLVAKFPYKYMKDPDDRVSRQFFADNRFYRRRWHLHYLHPPQSFSKGALLLVPLSQVQKLVDEISSAFKVEVNVPPFPFVLDFYDDGTPRPTFLATTTSRDGVNDKTELIPSIEEGHGECPPFATADLIKAYQVFRDKVERALLAIKGKSTKSNQKKAKELFQVLEESRNQLKRTERYLGLRPRTEPLESRSDLSWDEDKLYRESQQRDCGLFIDFLDFHKPAQYPFEGQPIFIAIDVESYERNHSFITEVGISTLDSLDLVGLAPGLTGENWVKQIRSRHFRIRGREHLVNKDFCIGHPEAFQFGNSEFVSLNTIVDVVDSCFEWPFSVQYKKESRTAPCNRKRNELLEIDPATIQKGSRVRNLIVVGHDIGADLNYLRNLGSEIFGPQLTVPVGQDTPSTNDRHQILASVLETLDTATIYKSFRMELQPRSLSHVCSDLGIEAWFVHNAGNDARYTLEALVKLAIQARLDEDEGQRKRDPESKGVIESEWEAQKMRQIDERVESARQKVRRKMDIQDENLNAGTSTSTSTDTDKIDWSLPIRTKKLKKSRLSGVGMEEQIHGSHAEHEPETEAAGTVWQNTSEKPTPKTPAAGW